MMAYDCVPAGPFDHVIAGFMLAPDVVWPWGDGTQKACSAGIGPLFRTSSTRTFSLLTVAASAASAVPMRTKRRIPPRAVGIWKFSPLRAMGSLHRSFIINCFAQASRRVNRQDAAIRSQYHERAAVGTARTTVQRPMA